MRLVHADAIVTGDGPALRDAAVLVRADGTIESVGVAASMLPAHHGVPVERVAGVVMPGLVNAHTHIELSALHERVRAGGGFFRWADEMLGLRMELEDEETMNAIDAAVRALDAFGTAAVGEVTNTLEAVAPLAAAGMAGAVFHEVFGIEREPVLARAAQLAHDVADRFTTWPSSDLSYAPSPHTLYTTHPDGVRKLLAMARERGARASLHLLEHAAERRAIEHGDGDAPAWLKSRVPDAEGFLWPRVPVLEYAASLDAIRADVLLVHLTEAKPRELERIAAAEAPVVLCPRSNATIEQRVPPVEAMRKAGVAPALGTDSLASCPSLDVLAEAVALRTIAPEVPAADLLRMATWNGARALGRSDLGRVAPGTRPGLFAIDAPLAAHADIDEHVLRHASAPRRWIARRHNAAPASTRRPHA